MGVHDMSSDAERAERTSVGHLLMTLVAHLAVLPVWGFWSVFVIAQRQRRARGSIWVATFTKEMKR
jgi:hypothetical protein